MNEPTERAQIETGKVTAKQLLAVVRQATHTLSLHGRAALDRPSYSDAFVFEVNATKRDRSGVESRTTIDVPGWVGNGNTSTTEESGVGRDRYARYSEAFRPSAGFWFIGSGSDNLIDVLESLPGDAQVAFSVALDYGTNEYLIRAECPMNFGTERGLHTDFLYLNATVTVRGKTKTRRFLIDTHTGPHNSSRFGWNR